MRYLILSLLPACVAGVDVPSPPGLESQFACVAVMTCGEESTTADFQRCRESEDEALDDVQAACEKYAADVGCPDARCDVSCSYRSPCAR